MSEYPETPAGCFDLCHELFGFGDFDEDANPDPPWFKYRMTEIGKMSRWMKRRNLGPKTVMITARYVHARGIQVPSFGWLAEHTKDALIAHRKAEQDAKRAEAGNRLQNAVEAAVEAGHHEWADRLLRTPPAAAEQAIRAYEEETK